MFFDDIPHGQGSWNVRFDAGCTLLINVGCQMCVVIFSQLPIGYEQYYCRKSPLEGATS